MESANNINLFQILDDLVTFILAEKSNAQIQASVQGNKDGKTKEIIAKTFQNIYDHFMATIAFHNFLNPLLLHINPPQKNEPLSKMISQQLPSQLIKSSKQFKNLHFSLQYHQEISQRMIKDIKSAISKHLKHKVNSRFPNNYQQINDSNFKIISENSNKAYLNVNDQLESLPGLFKTAQQQIVLIQPAFDKINQLLPKLKSSSEDQLKSYEQVSHLTSKAETLLAADDKIVDDIIAIVPLTQVQTSSLSNYLEDFERQMRDHYEKVINDEIPRIIPSYLWAAYNKSIHVYSKDNILDKSDKYLLNYTYKDNGEKHRTIMKTQQGDIVVGGWDRTLYKYSSSFKLIKSEYVGESIYCGIVIDNVIFCGCIGSLCIFNEDLQLLKSIKTQEIVFKILVEGNNCLLLGQDKGFIDIYEISTQKTILKTQLSIKDTHIYDIITTQNEREYAFATENGLYFGTINNDNTFTENKHEVYFKGKSVHCFVMKKPHMIFACVYGMTSIQVIDRNQKQVVKQIENSSSNGRYNCLQKIIGYDEENLPFLILKDGDNITIINTKTFEAIPIIQCKYDQIQRFNSMVQHKEGNQTKLLTLYYDDKTEERMIKEFIINEI